MHIIIRGLFPLFLLFCLLEVRCLCSISIGHSKPSFSWNTCSSFPSQSSHVSLESFYHLLSGYISLTYSLDILASAQGRMDQSDSQSSIRFSIFADSLSALFTFSSSWFSVNSKLFIKSNTSFLTSSVCCLVIEKFPLIMFEMFFSCWANLVRD